MYDQMSGQLVSGSMVFIRGEEEFLMHERTKGLYDILLPKG